MRNLESIKGSTVFIVDDNKEDLKVMVLHLSKIDLEVVPFFYGEELLIQIKNKRPDIILLDILMPGKMDGYETCKRLKADKWTKDIPIIFMTALSETVDKVKGFSLGAVDYITKPFEIEEVFSRIETHLSIHSLQQELTNLNLQLEEKVLKRTEELSNSNLRLLAEIEERKQTQYKLEVSEMKYRELYDNIPIGVFRINQKGQFVSANLALVNMLGYSSSEELLNSDLFILDIYKYKQPSNIDVFEKMDNVRSYEMQVRRKDNSMFWAAISLRFKHDKIGNEKYYDGIIGDITKRKIAEQELIKLSHTIEQSPVSVIITDTEGNIEYVNHQFVKSYGYKMKEVIGKNPRFLNAHTLPESIYENLWKKLKAGKPWIGELQNKTSRGNLYWVNTIISPIKNESNKVTHFVAIEENITEKKKLWSDLVESKNKAEKSNRAISAFLSIISHELRTSLNSIIGFSGLISEEMTVEEVVCYNKYIHNSGQHLLGLIKEIFNISLISSKDMSIKKDKFMIGLIMEEIREFIEYEVSAKNKEELKFIEKVHPDLKDSPINTDRKVLKHILFVLLKNAIKYTKNGSVEYGCNLENDNELLFYVKDTGSGIPKSKHEIIFEPFRQGNDVHTHEYGGLGVGLSIARQLVELLNGKIWLESEVDKGSTFFFTIPYDKVISQKELPKEEVEELEEKKLKGKTILIAEDENSNYQYLKAVLENLKMNTIWAKNGLEAVEECKSNENIDLVLMDIRMPVMDGVTAYKKIMEFRPKLPVIAQTAYAMAGDSDKAKYIGINAYIVKPISSKVLIDTISKFIG